MLVTGGFVSQPIPKVPTALYCSITPVTSVVVLVIKIFTPLAGVGSVTEVGAGPLLLVRFCEVATA